MCVRACVCVCVRVSSRAGVYVCTFESGNFIGVNTPGL